MAAAAQSLPEKTHLWSENSNTLPDWVVNPEDLRHIIKIQRAMGTTIVSASEFFRLHCKIFKCVVVRNMPSPKKMHKKMPSIDVLTSTGNHSGILMPSLYFQQDSPHTKAYLMFRPMNLDTQNTWCSNFQRISNSIGVVQLAYGKFIEVFERYFVTGTFTSSQFEELFHALNESIEQGRDIFTNKLKDLLTRFRNKKAKGGQNFEDRKTYEEFIRFITDVLRNDLLESVGSSLPIGSLATLELIGDHDTYPKRNDGGSVTATFQKAAYNSFVIITVTTENGDIITIQIDIDRSSFPMELGNKISFWNGKFIEHTTSYEFIQQVIDKLDAAAAGGGAGVDIDATAVTMARMALSEIMNQHQTGDPRVKFGINKAITTGCQVPMLMFHSDRTNEVDVVFPPRLRDGYESVIGMEPIASNEEGYTGYTGNFILCPSFSIPKSLSECNNVLFFSNCPSKMGEWFHFPNYDHIRSNAAIGFHEGMVQSSMSPEFNSQPRLSSPSPDTPADHVAASSASIPRPDSETLADAAGAASHLLDVEVEVGGTKPPSFFRSIFNKCVSYFFSATVGRNITQTNFFDDNLNVDKLIIRNALELADDVDRADDELLVHAAHHALDAVFDLIGAFELDELDETNTELQVMIKLARAAATQLSMVRNCVHVAAFAVRGVACICACKNAPSGCQPLSVVIRHFAKLTGLSQTLEPPSMMNDAAQIAFEYNGIVIQETERVLLPLAPPPLPLAPPLPLPPAQPLLPLHNFDSKRSLTPVISIPTKRSKGGRLRSRRYLHRVSHNQKRTLKKKNISRKYSKYSRSGCDGIRTRSLRRRRRRSYSRKIGKYNK